MLASCECVGCLGCHGFTTGVPGGNGVCGANLSRYCRGKALRRCAWCLKAMEMQEAVAAAPPDHTQLPVVAPPDVTQLAAAAPPPALTEELAAVKEEMAAIKAACTAMMGEMVALKNELASLIQLLQTGVPVVARGHPADEWSDLGTEQCRT